MRRRKLPAARRHAFTLIEVLVAAAITLLIMATLAQMFVFVNGTVAESRAVVEMTDQLRACKHRLQKDLSLLTAPTIPPLRPEAEQGYLEIIEGPIGPIFRPDDLELAANQNHVEFDDVDDIIMFTARAPAHEPFVGRWSGSSTQQSQVAEIAWFLRGTTLYRRVLLVMPHVTNPWDFSYARTASASYNSFDLSMRQEGGGMDRRAMPPPSAGVDNMPRCVPNSLGDLTKRENRFAHQPLVWPYDVRMWGRVSGSMMPGLGLPTLAECCHAQWPWPIYEPVAGYPGASTMLEAVPTGSDPRDVLIIPSIATTSSPAGFSSASNGGILLTANGRYDPLGTHPDVITSSNPIRYPNSRPVTQIDGLNRLSNFAGGRYDDIIMTNVMTFDVKVWDPGAPLFENNGDPRNPVPIVPGDWGYLDAIRQFVNTGANTPAVSLVGFGAYVDLNYMQPLGVDPYDPAIMRLVPPIASANPAVPPPPPFPYPAVSPSQGNYEAALRKYESGQRLPLGALPRPKFSGPGDSGSAVHGVLARPPFHNSPLAYPGFLAAVYDTWSTHYENDGRDNNGNGQVDEGTDGVDNPPFRFGIDDPSEVEAPPPYPWALRGVQIKIRAFEPATKQIREVTVVTEFLPE